MATAKKTRIQAGSVAAEAGAASSANTRERIAICAYYKAEARGFAPGGELGDWAAAEAEINAYLQEQ